MRGKPVAAASAGGLARYIPACAGEASFPQVNPPERRVHPRVCGGSAVRRQERAKRGGTSPRVRGKHRRIAETGRVMRYIPACAGEARCRRPRRRPGRVHPRVCGGSDCRRRIGLATRGTSPRVRGKPFAKSNIQQGCRYIPACAGEAIPGGNRRSDSGVHPRVCGGSASPRRAVKSVRGTSPRVRGKLVRRGSTPEELGYIPACAGEAPAATRPEPARGVHPRVCGGSGRIAVARPRSEGTSPRVRGKPASTASCAVYQGYIPACAGEASTSSARARRRRVHPRVCGGSTTREIESRPVKGTSPRVRGKRRPVCIHGRSGRYIPACAGEALGGKSLIPLNIHFDIHNVKERGGDPRAIAAS